MTQVTEYCHDFNKYYNNVNYIAKINQIVNNLSTANENTNVSYKMKIVMRRWLFEKMCI